MSSRFIVRSILIAQLLALAPAHAEGPALGQGIDLESGFLRETCIQGTMKSLGRGEATLETSHGRDLRDESQSLEGKVSGGVNLGLVGAKVSVDYLSRMAKYDLRDTFELTFSMRLPTQRLFAPSLKAETDLGAATPAAQRQRCGNGAITTVVPGFRFRAAMVLDFKNEESYERFKKVVKTRVLWKTRTKTVVNEIKKQSGAFGVHFEILQEGGPQTAANLLRSQMPACEASDIETCLDAFQKIVDFVNAGEGQSGLRDQLIQAAATIGSATGPVVIEYEALPYDKIPVRGIISQQADDPQAHEAGSVALRLEILVAESRALLQRARFLSVSPSMTMLTQAILQRTQLNLENWADSLTRNAQACSISLSSASCITLGMKQLGEAEQALSAIKKEINP